jgi:F420 biosynthesis protein FbiB-like protein
MGARLRADRLADGDAGGDVERDVSRSRARITAAPVAIVACLSMADMDAYPDARRAEAERTMTMQSTALAVQNLLLAAHALGLGACWLCAPLFCPDAVREVLKLPEDWEPQALVTMGWPAETRTKERRSIQESVLYVEG